MSEDLEKQELDNNIKEQIIVLMRTVMKDKYEERLGKISDINLRIKEDENVEEIEDIDFNNQDILFFPDNTWYKYTLIHNWETFIFYNKDEKFEQNGKKLVLIKYFNEYVSWETDSEWNITVSIDWEEVSNPVISSDGDIQLVVVWKEEVIVSEETLFKYNNAVSLIALSMDEDWTKNYKAFINWPHSEIQIWWKEVSFNISDSGIITSSLVPYPVINFDEQWNLITYEVDWKRCLAFDVTKINDKISYGTFIDILTWKIVINKERDWVGNLDNYKTDQHLLIDWQYIEPEDRIKEIGLSKKANRIDVTYISSNTISWIIDINDVKISNEWKLARWEYNEEQCIIWETKKVWKYIFSKLYDDKTWEYLWWKIVLAWKYIDLTLDWNIIDPFKDYYDYYLNPIDAKWEVETHLFNWEVCIIKSKRLNVYQLFSISKHEYYSGVVFSEWEFQKIEIEWVGEDEEYPCYKNKQVMLDSWRCIENPDIDEKWKIHIHTFGRDKYIPLRWDTKYNTVSIKTFYSLGEGWNIYKIIKEDWTFWDITIDWEEWYINYTLDTTSWDYYHRLRIWRVNYRFIKKWEENIEYKENNNPVPLIWKDGEIIKVQNRWEEYMLRSHELGLPFDYINEKAPQCLLKLIYISESEIDREGGEKGLKRDIIEHWLCLQIDWEPVMPTLDWKQWIILNNWFIFEVDWKEYKGINFNDKWEAIVTSFSYKIDEQGPKEFKNIWTSVFIISWWEQVEITDSNLVTELIQASVKFEVKEIQWDSVRNFSSFQKSL